MSHPFKLYLFFGSIISPCLPFSIKFGITPTLETTTDNPADIASIIEFGRPSAHEGSTKISFCDNNSARFFSSIQPSNSM